MTKLMANKTKVSIETVAAISEGLTGATKMECPIRLENISRSWLQIFIYLSPSPFAVKIHVD
jgi:hypothetical protein